MNKLPRALPAEMGIDPKGLLAFVEQLQGNGCHSVMVLRRNTVVAEGWWKPYQPQYNHILYSLSKSFTSIAVGFAVQEGLFSIEDRVLSFFPEELPYQPCENMQKMRVKHLLTMSTGHSKEPGYVFQSENWVYAFLTSYVDCEPGSQFVYNSAATFMLSAIIQRVSGLSLLEYLRPRLLDPLDISDIWWEVDPQGINTGGFGLNAKTEDIAKFGAFLLNRGAWEGKQLLSAGWIDEATTKQIETENSQVDWRQGYGYQFWRCSQEGSYRGDGAFGQFCVVIPDYDVVVAITSGIVEMHKSLEMIWKWLLPAIHDSVEPDAQAQEALEQALAHLKVATPQGERSGSSGARYSDRIYHLAENALGLTRLSFHFGDAETVTLWNGDEPLTLEIGYNQWKENPAGVAIDALSRRKAAAPGEIVACAGAWNGNVYTLKMVSCHREYSDSLEVTFDDVGIMADYQRNPPPMGRKAAYALMGRELK